MVRRLLGQVPYTVLINSIHRGFRRGLFADFDKFRAFDLLYHPVIFHRGTVVRGFLGQVRYIVLW